MLWNNPQQPNEKVDDFVIRIKKAASRIQVPDTVVQYALLNGMRPNIRTFVLQNNCQTTDEILRSGRIAEASLSQDPLSSALLETLKVTNQTAAQQAADLAKLTQTVSALATASAASSCPGNSTVAAINKEASVIDQHSSRQAPRSFNKPLRPQQQQRVNYGQRAVQANTRPDFTATACGRCARIHPANSCRAINETCFKCRKVGHFSRACRSAYKPPNSQ